MFIERKQPSPRTIQLWHLPKYHWFQYNDFTFMYMDKDLHDDDCNCINLTCNTPQYVNESTHVVPVEMFGSPKPLGKQAHDSLIEMAQR